MNLNYIGSLILESYQERAEVNTGLDKSYLAEVKENLLAENTKMDSLQYLFRMDAPTKVIFAKKINVSDEDLKVFMQVLQKV